MGDRTLLQLRLIRIRRDIVTEPRSTNRVFGILFVAAVLSCYSVAACHVAQPTVDYFTEYDLEIVNGTPQSVRILVHIGGQDFKDIETGVWVRSGDGSGIITLGSGERRTFRMSLFGGWKDSPEDNHLVTYFRRIGFFEENSNAPYKSYEYLLSSYDSMPRGCSDVPPASDCSDDAWLFERRPDGTGVRLFVESPDRPFNLERDQEDPDLARIVITFVPTRTPAR